MKLPKAFLSFVGICAFLPLTAQTPATTPSQIQEALELQEKMKSTSLVKNLRLENIGPSIMSGRVVDLDVNPEKPTEFFVAYASGGLWYTENNGTSFVPVLDKTPTQNLGDIAVHWPSGTIYAGTGENNASRSSYAGMGMFRSSDKGKTWSYAGLPDSHHIGRIVIDPRNPDHVVVAVLGHLYSPNEERGIFKTTDGGKTWSRTLYINEYTGMIDLVAAPDNPEVLFAASWERDRKAWNFKGSGPGSGIYKSSDGGDTWALMTQSGAGFPTGEGVGRIGLAAFDSNTVYAILDNQYRRPDTSDKKNPSELQKEDLRNISVADFTALDNARLNAFLKSNGFPEEYRADTVKEMVRNGSIRPDDLISYFEDANSVLFDTPVIGAEVYKSTDGGRAWNKTHKGFIEDLYYSYGYFFGQIRVAPYDPDQIYIVGVPILRSDNGGASFTSINGANVHADHHALWVNPDLKGHLVNGNDGGVNISYDFGGNWIKNNTPTVGQFYAINIDHQKPYNVYGGLQDNGVWKGPHNAEESMRWHQSGKYPWESIMGGDGMQIQIDSRNPDIVYTGFQFGNYFRLDLSSGSRTRIQPKHTLGESPYRFNWQTPILLSPHNQDILYLGSNKLHRSMNQGSDWQTISGDLSAGGTRGNVSYGTLTTISESPLRFGLLYTGSDDGFLQVSPDGGITWNRISDKLPQKLWVSRVAASAHSEGRVYAALNGYRWDDFTPYLFVSEDYGKSWKSIASGIPASPVNAIVEDPVNENLLFVGTDNGLYVSMNRGQIWNAMQNGMPHVAVHDLVIQPESKDLLVGTHGRSIYKASIAPLQTLKTDDLSDALIVFELPKLKHSGRWGNSYSSWRPPSSPGLDIVFYSQKGGKTAASIQTADGIVLSETELMADPGINVISYDVAFSEKGKKNYLSKYKAKLIEAGDGKTYLPKGAYKVILTNQQKEVSEAFTIE
ncbi:VPS10 domain-containing protein [Robiginitalea aurantiaca]|uniref:Glycosyl hydrolase n=1 Tax=Robiginitalea aurantiaca TaxID=3056915 RepID=A0ABT7WAL1_9FLAO|nr:glycosyl hydrolase [Robiginitalea aurantiaca]MDM9629960.1 glycosyl hydrolase [Robiginitalea aurantiaca]